MLRKSKPSLKSKLLARAGRKTEEESVRTIREKTTFIVARLGVHQLNGDARSVQLFGCQLEVETVIEI